MLLTLSMAPLAFIFSLLALCHLSSLEAATFTIINSCDYTVWPGILSNAGISQLTTTGFSLQKGESRAITTPSGWGGRFWGRTLCSTDTSGKFTCQTGDCGSGKMDCSGAGATPPATLTEFTLDGSSGMDFYDVSLVDGYNLPMLVTPRGGDGANCSITGCVVDLNAGCPSDLRVMSDEDGGGSGRAVACKSACDAFNSPQYCCSGEYGSPSTCKPSGYSMVFKKACPLAYSYAYDDKSSTFTCAGSPDYTITFCPSPNTSQKASSSEGQGTSSEDVPSIMNSTMVYEGALQDSASVSSHSRQLSLIVIAITSLTIILQLFRSGN